MTPDERTDELVSPAQTDTCGHKKRNICLCDWGDDCAIHSTPERIYDQIAKLRKERKEETALRHDKPIRKQHK